MEIHGSARRHGIADEDIHHAIANAMVIEDQDDGTGLAIHAMPMRSRYRRLLPGE